MRKIIQGKAYDTETSTIVGEWDNKVGITDFTYFHEALYRKRTGEYFIHGEGNAQSKYAVHRYGMWDGGEAITPLSYEDARRWAEEHLTAHFYEAEFGEVTEDDSQVVASYRVAASTKAAIQREAARTGETQGQVIDRLAKALGN